jgi:hypothetical protein
LFTTPKLSPKQIAQAQMLIDEGQRRRLPNVDCTPKQETDLIRQRLAAAERDHRERQN